MFFDFMKHGKTKAASKDSKCENNLLAIGMAISNDDTQVKAELETCINDTKAYFLENKERFEERGISEAALDEIRWISLVDILEINGYVCERDWQDELDDFVYFVEKLKGVASRKLALDLQWFKEEDDVSTWCEMLDEKWAEKGICIAGIDIGSDSYVLFPYETEKLGELSRLAEGLERRIVMAKTM